MKKTKLLNMIIEIEITEWDDLPDDHKYLAVLKSDKYPPLVEASGSVSGCLSEIAKSMYVLEEYRKRQNK